MRHRKIACFDLFACRCADIAACRTCEVSRKRKLRELYGVSTLITTGNPPQPHLWMRDEVSDDERQFLEKNDISR